MANEITSGAGTIAEHAYAAGCFQGLAWRLRAFSKKIAVTETQQAELDDMIEGCENLGKHYLALSKPDTRKA